jgi:hypothetical protein
MMEGQMADQTCVWTGASGTKYTYYIYPRGTTVNPADGNYVYSKLNNQNQWVPVYFGEGDLTKRAGSDGGAHHRKKCIDSKGATHVHMHLNDSKDSRRAEEMDLLARYINALEAGGGCNISPTG